MWFERPDVDPVKGRVTLDGKPVADAAVGLIPIEGGPMAGGVTNADGVFDLSTGNKPARCRENTR